MADWIGDYRFDPSDALANSAAGGLPALHFDSFDAKHPPLLTGQMVPRGNGYALAWTKQVPQVGYEGWTPANLHIPAHDQFKLGGQFTIWVRLLYGGYARGNSGYNLIQSGQVKWGTTKEEEMAVAIGDKSYATTGQRLLPRFSRWYDLAMVVDGPKLTLYATPITQGGPLETRSQSFDIAPPSNVTGPLHLMRNTNTAVEHLRIADNALTAAQIKQLSASGAVPGPQSTTDNEIAVHRQLFLDGAVIERMDSHVTRKLHQPRKHPDNPVIRRTQPKEIEGFGPTFWGSVIYDEQEQVFKCWHQALTFKQPEIFNHLYATSKDGIHWTKLDVDYRPPAYRGGHAGMWLTLRKDMDEPDPAMRYKGFIQHNPLWYVTSPDGLSWTDRGVAAPYTDDTSTAVYHPQHKQYLKLGRFCADGRSLALRSIMACVSDSPLAEGNTLWHLIMLPTEEDLARDPYQQFYHMPAFAYGDTYIGLLGMYFAGPDSGESETELTFSRDGLNWHRVAPHEPFIARGGDGEWDSGFGGLPGTGPIVRGDELWFYYSHYNNGHHGPFKDAGIGLATLRRDGFVSLSSTQQPARMVTRPFELAGNAVSINAVGKLHVELLDIDGKVLLRSEMFDGDDCDYALNWRNANDLSAYRGREVKIRFEFTGDLYAFQVTEN